MNKSFKSKLLFLLINLTHQKQIPQYYVFKAKHLP